MSALGCFPWEASLTLTLFVIMLFLKVLHYCYDNCRVAITIVPLRNYRRLNTMQMTACISLHLILIIILWGKLYFLIISEGFQPHPLKKKLNNLPMALQVLGWTIWNADIPLFFYLQKWSFMWLNAGKWKLLSKPGLTCLVSHCVRCFPTEWGLVGNKGIVSQRQETRWGLCF